MNQDKFNCFELVYKQDTTSNEIHFNQCNIDQSVKKCQDSGLNVQVLIQSYSSQNDTLEQNQVVKDNQILHTKNIIDMNNDQNNQIKIRNVETKKFKKKSNLTCQVNQSNHQKSPQKLISPTFMEQSVKSNANDNDLQQNQKKLSQGIQAIKQKMLIGNTQMIENQEINNQSKDEFLIDDQTSFSQLDQVNSIKKSQQSKQIIDLNNKNSYESNKQFKSNNQLLEVQNSVLKQTIKEDKIDYHIMNQAKSLMIKKLDMDMREFNDIILSQNQQILKLRRIIYDRLAFIINYLFKGFNYHISQLDYNSQIRLFGSCVTGLALPESDIDIGITGFEMCSTSQLYIPIQKLTEFLQKMRWVNSIVSITTSSMPLIKLQVDPNISFVQCSTPINLPYIDLNPDDYFTRQIFSVDISFFQYLGSKQNQHLGLISTELTLQWLSIYNELRSIVLLFKSLLKKRGLNDQFKGGMSSFCIIQMVLAFLECFYHENQSSSIGYTTYNFLKFYGTEFDPKMTGISYKGFNQNTFYDLNEYDDQSEITIVSPITNEIISSATSFVSTILQDLKTLYYATENEVMFFYEKLKYNKKKKGRKEQRNLFQKELNKLRPLFSTTVNNNNNNI